MVLTLINWFGPVARVMAFALSGIALPLSGDVAKELAEASGFMSKLGGVPMSGGVEFDKHQEDPASHDTSVAWVEGADLEVLHDFLKQLKLAPQFGGMKLVKITNKGYMWVAANEAEAHAEPKAVIAYVGSDPTKVRNAT